MGSGFNMPDGCYESDIPGWNDIEIDYLFSCEECNCEWEELVDVDPTSQCDFESTCPDCGTLEVVKGYHHDQECRDRAEASDW